MNFRNRLAPVGPKVKQEKNGITLKTTICICNCIKQEDKRKLKMAGRN